VIRWLAFTSLFVLLLFARVQADEAPMLLSGGDLPHQVRLAAADTADFQRRTDSPPTLDNTPATSGLSYTLSTGYWDRLLRENKDDKPPIQNDAAYYPQGGFVHARQGGKDVWFVIDLKQQAIVNRYVRVGAQLSETPGVLEVLREAALAGEPIEVQVGPRLLDESQRAQFWQVAKAATSRPDILAQTTQGTVTPPKDTNRATSTWLVFNLPEARSVRLYYNVPTGVLFDETGTELYPVPARWLVPILGPDAAPGSSFSLGPEEVPQQKGRGSPVWWFVMLGAGFACLAAALWWQRRFGRNQSGA
jgi:hypothetical protein